ncbi:MAG: tetratricopeptide repeat protein [Chthoniobacter sp.]
MALALLAFIRHARDGRWAQYALSLLWFAAALACKTSTVFLPVFLSVIYVFSREKGARALLLRLVPFYALGLAAGVTTMWFEKNRVEAHSLLNTLSLWQRLEMAGATFWFYLGKALVPVNLTPMYRGWVDTTAAAHTMLPGLLLVALLLACAIGWRRIGAPVALGIAYYALMLLPLLGIFDTNYFAFSLVADHWQYHALPGILVAIVAGLQRLAQHWPRLAAYPQAVGGLAVVGVAALASAHFAHFENPRSLWSYVVAQNPDAWLGWYNLGNVYIGDQQPAEAIDAYRRSIRIRPHYFQSRYNLANSLFGQGDIAAAEREYFAAEKINLADPAPHNNRGSALLALHREDEARVEFASAVALDPSLIPPRINLIALLVRRGQLDEARQHLRSVGPLSPYGAHRIADAIIASAKTGSVPAADLRQFAQLACELNASQPELQALLSTLPAPPTASSSTSPP